jgi:type VI secretion system protein ImpA
MSARTTLPPTFDVSRLLEPVSTDAPCGPDLDAAADADFLNLLARTEGLLPTTFFTRDDEGRAIPFDRPKADTQAALAEITGSLEGTRDLRLLTLGARLLILDRDLDGFAAWLTGIATLVSERWTDVHPQSEGGDYGLRLATLQALDDTPTVILPLQHVTLAESRRWGPVTFRRLMAAAGEVASPEENPVDRTSLERAIAEAEPIAIENRRRALTAVRHAAGTIRRVTAEQSGPSAAVSLDRLDDLAARMLAALGSEVSSPAPSEEAGPVSAEPQPLAISGSISTAAEAARALASAATYFAAGEPSCPAALLVAQARQLIGRSFAEAVAMLVPNYADQANLTVGVGGASFALPITQLASLAAPECSEILPDDEAVPAESRAEAVARMRAAAVFYRDSEPSSPIPLLLDRACALVNRDFLSLLRDALPESALMTPADS